MFAKVKAAGDDNLVIPPPPFNIWGLERVLVYQYDIEQKTWIHSLIFVQEEKEPFARGGMRAVHRMADYSCTGEARNKVVKFYLKPVDRDVYFHDVMMQTIAKKFAKLYNERNPPKKVDFVDAWVVEFVERAGKDLGSVELALKGEYKKHNNNLGYVSAQERMTPQAFSHFTYEVSEHSSIVVDIQGVDDIYTDPQIHTQDGKGFGEGNCGKEGIDAFFETHHCNPLCALLALPPASKTDKFADHPVSTQLPLSTRKTFNPRFELERVIPAHAGGVTTMLVVGDAKRELLSGAADGFLKVWNNKFLTAKESIEAHSSTVKCICAIGTRIYTGSIDSTIKVWDLATLHCLSTIETHQDGVWSLAATPTFIASGSSDGSIHVWNAETLVSIALLEDAHKNVISSLHHHNNLLYSSSWDCRIKVWDTRTWNQVRMVEAHEEAISCMIIYDGRLLTGSWDMTIKVWDLESWECKRVLRGHTDMITSLLGHEDLIVSGSYDHTIRVWALESKVPSGPESKDECLKVLEFPKKQSGLSFAVARAHLFAGLSSGEIVACS